MILALVTIISSCEDFLDEVPKSQVSPENFYKTGDDAEAAVIGAYNALQRSGVVVNPMFIVTDLVRTATWNSAGGLGTYTFSSQNGQIGSIWKDSYQGINEANAAITHIPKIDMDVDRRNTLIAEARFLRALFYFNLVRYFGDVPYMGTETNSLENLEVPRDPASLVYEKIIADLEFGIEHLDIKSNEIQKGRATVGSAKSLLAYVYLTRGSMTKRDGLGDGLADFQLAATLAGEVIADGRYQLCDYFPDAFTRMNKNNDEIIFDVQFKNGGIEEGNYIGMHMGITGSISLGGSWGNIQSTDYYHTIYEPTDMVRQQWSSCHVQIKNNDGTMQIFSENSWQTWRIGKFRRYPVHNADYVFNDHDVHWPVLRLADVLLIYAEALNEVNNGPNDDVFTALNELRKRARNVNGDGTVETLHADILPRSLTYDANILPDISIADYPDYDSMKEYIMFERARELGAEGKRWFDLVRWGKLVEQIKFLDTYVPPGRNNPEGYSWKNISANIKEHHILMPIPRSEIDANPKLEQNLGY